MPQWDFLDFVTRHAATYQGFRLLMETEATGLAVERGRVTGLTLADGAIPAALTVAADGRGSTVRQAARLPVRTYDAPMDVLWLRLSRRESDAARTAGRVAPGRVLIRIDRGDYWQVGYVIEKGGYDRLRATGWTRSGPIWRRWSRRSPTGSMSSAAGPTCPCSRSR
jgi:2-polyprenyl-6-methoxyphenol hydroxylase-like FAD-dependent oxidoreductase